VAALYVTERPPPVPERVRVQRAEGPPALAALIGREYARAALRCQGEPQWMRITQVALHHARLDRISSHVNCELSLDPLGAWHVGRLEAGRMTVLTEGRAQTYGPGQMYLLGPGQRLRVQLESPQLDLAVIRPALLSEVTAGAATALPPVPTVAPCTDAVRAWARAYHHIRKTVVSDGPAPAAVVVDALERLLVASTLALWSPAGDQTSAAVRGERDGYSETLRRAIAFIEANPAADICIDDIADAACVTVRAVQLAFRRQLNTTPMAYLRGVRLACAHAELQSGDPEQTVGAIAKRWGFGNAGRFAAAYRAAYGHAPLSTLRNLRTSA
jgi:AraC-like DNA-binding protein